MRTEHLKMLLILALLMPAASAHGATGREHKFKFSKDGFYPYGPVTFDGTGNLYMTLSGGNGDPYPWGAVLKFSAGPDGHRTESVIYSFTGYPADGGYPHGGLTFDNSGNLYGTTAAFGKTGGGTVFRLSPNQDGTWTEKVLYAFKLGADGSYPTSTLVFDAVGNLYGTTQAGGLCNENQYCGGTVFKLTPGQGDTWTETVIYSFPVAQNQGGGTYPSSLTIDSSGNLYGTTYMGGNALYGTVFELTPNQDGTWTQNTLWNFTDGLDGGFPTGGVIFDNAGNLYGEASQGGSFACPVSGCGLIFKVTPEAGSWKYSVVYKLDGINGRKGWGPWGGLTLDSAGNLYGTTLAGGDLECVVFNLGCGTIFELTPSLESGPTFRIIASFNGVDGFYPMAGVTLDSAGNIYGTTQQGGDLVDCPPHGCGTVFTITP